MQNHDPAATWNAPEQLRAEASLRRAISADATSIRELTRAAYTKWVPVIGREPLPMAADYDTRVRDHLIDLLHEQGRLVALIETVPETDHLLIENVAVLPSFQGRGYGRSLLAHAERLAVSLGLSQTRLYTNRSLAGNVRLYQKLGYGVDREEPFMGVSPGTSHQKSCRAEMLARRKAALDPA